MNKNKEFSNTSFYMNNDDKKNLKYLRDLYDISSSAVMRKLISIAANDERKKKVKKSKKNI